MVRKLMLLAVCSAGLVAISGCRGVVYSARVKSPSFQRKAVGVVVPPFVGIRVPLYVSTTRMKGKGPEKMRGEKMGQGPRRMMGERPMVGAPGKEPGRREMMREGAPRMGQARRRMMMRDGAPMPPPDKRAQVLRTPGGKREPKGHAPAPGAMPYCPKCKGPCHCAKKASGK